MKDEYYVFNPHEKEVLQLPVIYGYNAGGQPGWYYGQLVGENGEGLGGHICSTERWMLYDLGILPGTRPDRHETFRLFYPDGYRMEFVSNAELDNNDGWKEAFRKNQESDGAGIKPQ